MADNLVVVARTLWNRFAGRSGVIHESYKTVLWQALVALPLEKREQLNKVAPAFGGTPLVILAKLQKIDPNLYQVSLSLWNTRITFLKPGGPQYALEPVDTAKIMEDLREEERKVSRAAKMSPSAEPPYSLPTVDAASAEPEDDAPFGDVQGLGLSEEEAIDLALRQSMGLA